MLEYNWPGNVRELENFIERLTALSQARLIQDEDIRRHLSANARPIKVFSPGDLTLAEIEKRAILEALKRFQNNQRITAEKLGISTTTLWRKIKEYDIEMGL